MTSAVRAPAPEPCPARRVGLISGTGPYGRGLARRLALAGHEVYLGSRDAGRATVVVDKLVARVAPAEDGQLIGADNVATAAQADIVLVTCAWEALDALLGPLASVLAGKIVVSCVNPLGFDSGGAYRLPQTHPSAAEYVADLLPESRVVAALHHLSAVRLLDPAAGVRGEDVLVCGDWAPEKDVVRELCVGLTGRVGIDAGPLRVARYIEPFTAVLIAVNRNYGAQTGVVFTNVDEPAQPGASSSPPSIGTVIPVR